jgi:hypothetical protein
MSQWPRAAVAITSGVPPRARLRLVMPSAATAERSCPWGMLAKRQRENSDAALLLVASRWCQRYRHSAVHNHRQSK